MKRVVEFTLSIALVALAALVAGIIANLVAVQGFNSNWWLLVGAFLVIGTLPGTLFIIRQTAQEKRAIKPDDSNVTTVMKSVAGRIRISEGSVTVEASDAESAVKAWQEIHENLLKAESRLTVEVKEPEDWQDENAPDTVTATKKEVDIQALVDVETRLLMRLIKQQQKASEVPETKENEEHGKST